MLRPMPLDAAAPATFDSWVRPHAVRAANIFLHRLLWRPPLQLVVYMLVHILDWFLTLLEMYKREKENSNERNRNFNCTMWQLQGNFKRTNNKFISYHLEQFWFERLGCVRAMRFALVHIQLCQHHIRTWKRSDDLGHSNSYHSRWAVLLRRPNKSVGIPIHEINSTGCAKPCTRAPVDCLLCSIRHHCHR